MVSCLMFCRLLVVMRLFCWGRRVRGEGLYRYIWAGRGSHRWWCVGSTGRKGLILVGRGQGGRGWG